MDIPALIFVIIFVYIILYVPGRVLVQLLPLDEGEKFSLSFGISIFLFYLFGFASYVFNLQDLILPTCISLFIFSLIFALKQYQKINVKKEIQYFAVFFLPFIFLVSYQSLLPFYSGGLWYFDWYEHYARVLFFLEQSPVKTLVGPYYITARPPLFNVAAFFLQRTLDSSFWIYQIIASLFNILIILPIYLLVRYFLNNKNVSFILIVAIIIFVPSVIAQATYTQTKALTAYYILMALYFYLQGKKAEKPLFFYLTGTLLGMGLLSHYSTAPYIVIILLDYSFELLKKCLIKAQNWKKSILTFCLTLLIFLLTISSWFIWSTWAMGPYQTFLGNTSYEWQQGRTTNQFLEKNLTNLKHTLIPMLPSYHYDQTYPQDFPIMLYDNIFSLYNVSLAGSLTFTLSIIAIGIVLLKYRRIFKNYFLIFLITLNIIIGIIAEPNPIGGIAHITLFATTLLILAFIIKTILSNKSNIPKVIMLLILTTFLLESLGNLILRAYVTRKYLYQPILSNSYSSILQVHVNNYSLKMNNGLVFLYDKFIDYQLIFILICLILLGFFVFIVFKTFMGKTSTPTDHKNYK